MTFSLMYFGVQQLSLSYSAGFIELLLFLMFASIMVCRDNRMSTRGGRGERRRRFDQAPGDRGMKRGRDATGWRPDGRRGSIPSKRKKGEDIIEDWMHGKTVRDLAINERLVPREFVWEDDESKYVVSNEYRSRCVCVCVLLNGNSRVFVLVLLV